MKATAKAPANIAFIKYWGKLDEKLRLPCNDSISMNLSHAFTITTVEFSDKYHKDEFIFMSNVILGRSEATTPESDSGQARMTKQDVKEEQRVIKQLDRIRKIADSKLFAKVVTKNSFPKGTGIASSASGFAALTLAAAAALNLKLSEKELSILARLGSGSACRSIPDGFVEWKSGNTSVESYAYSLFDENYWDLKDIIVLVSPEEKKTSSSKGHENVNSSLFFKTRLANLPDKIKRFKKALQEKNINIFGELLEGEAVELHTIMMTQSPPLFYWNSATMDIIKKVQDWREQGLSVYFTIDAGPNVHLICGKKEEKIVLVKLKESGHVDNLIINSPAKGAKIIDQHLF